jgi:hypothetical protein
MSQSAPEPAPAQDDALAKYERLPRRTTPTWEVELLIAGATVFALLQLPGLLDTWFYTYFPRFGRPMAELIIVPYVYAKSAAYALIATFVLHLSARGYWVALIGLRSVYPDGVRWDNLRWGPLYRHEIQARTPSAEDLIERADNRASVIFGYGIGFALVVIAPLLFVAIVTLATIVFQLLTLAYFPWQKVWYLLFAGIFLPFMLAVSIDRWFGKKLAPDGLPARSYRAVLRTYLRAGMSSFSSYPTLMFMSRAGQKRGGAVLALGVALLAAISFVQLMVHEGDLSIGNYAGLEPGEPGSLRALRAANYADQRGADAAAPEPFIPSEIARGDYLRLFVPYRPARDSAAVEKQCELPQNIAPESITLQAGDDELERALAERTAGDAARSARLDCLARIYAVTLDSQPLPDLQFDLADDPASGLRGVLAMIRIADLAPGRHLLEIQRPPSPIATEHSPPPRPHRIVFWR